MPDRFDQFHEFIMSGHGRRNGDMINCSVDIIMRVYEVVNSWIFVVSVGKHGLEIVQLAPLRLQNCFSYSNDTIDLSWPWEKAVLSL